MNRYEIVFPVPVVQDTQNPEYLEGFVRAYGDPQNYQIVDDVNDALETVFGADCDIDWRDEKTVVIITASTISASGS